MPDFSWGTTKPPSGTPVNRSHPLAQGLIGSWLMSEGAGSLLVDSAGNSPGIIEAGPTWQGGRFGAALKFDTSHKASISNTSPLNVALTTSRVTVEAYAFYTSGTNQGLVDLTNAGSTNLGYQLFLENTPAVAKFRVNKSGGSDTLTSTVTVTTGWHQFVGTYDLTTYVVYLDGVATTTVKPSNTLVSASGPLLIGKLGSAVYPFAGQISHVRIWNRPLTQAEINQLRAEPFAMYAPPVWRRYFIGGAPVIYTQSLTGAVTSNAAVVNSVGKRVTGTLTSAGNAVKLITRLSSASATISGIVVKNVTRSAGASVAGSGLVINSVGKRVTGAITSAGAIIKHVAFSTSASMSISGAVLKLITRVSTATITSSAVTTKVVDKVVSGSVTSGGNIVKSIATGVTGTVISTGTIAKQAGKVYTGVVSSGATVVKKVTKLVSASVAMGGILVKLVGTHLTGIITTSGSISSALRYYVSFVGTITSSGTMRKNAELQLVGTVTSVGTLAKHVGKALTGAISSLVGTLTALIRRPISADLIPDDLSAAYYTADDTNANLYSAGDTNYATYIGDESAN